MSDKPRVRAILANENETYQLNSGITTVGRKGDAIIQGEGVEDVHALIKYKEDQQIFTILDVNTCHGTTVNEERMDLCFQDLNNGDSIRFGLRDKPLTFMVTSSPPAKGEQKSMVMNQQSACVKIGDVLKSMEEKHDTEELWKKLEDSKKEKGELLELICSVQQDMECKDESLRIMAEAAEKSRKENACLGLQNEALLNSVSRKYADCSGCRREDLMIQKDMENIKLKVQCQMNSERMDELKRCAENLVQEALKWKEENEELKKLLHSANEELSSMERSSDDFQKTELLGRVNVERTMKQLEHLKRPILEMVNVICAEDSNEGPIFPSVDALCMTRAQPFTSTPRVESTEPKGDKGSKGAAQVTKSQNGLMDCDFPDDDVARGAPVETAHLIQALEQITTSLKKNCSKELSKTAYAKHPSPSTQAGDKKKKKIK